MKTLRTLLLAASACGGVVGMSTTAQATDFSFTGNFAQDDDVQTFNFVVGAASNVTLRAWSYAGGVNAAGQAIARGGFDTILALFDSTGVLINFNDDGGCTNVGTDALTGRCWDTYLTQALGAGTYTVAISQYDNFALGPNFAGGFSRAGLGNFTPGIAPSCTAAQTQFLDVSGVNPGCGRDSHWAFDILNVEGATQTPGVPEPATWLMLLLGFGLAGGALRSTRRERIRVHYA